MKTKTIIKLRREWTLGMITTIVIIKIIMRSTSTMKEKFRKMAIFMQKRKNHRRTFRKRRRRD